MKAITYTKYGPPSVVSVTEAPKPTPRAHEVLVRIHATTVTAADWRARSLEMPAGFRLLGRLFFGLFGPRKQILGSELAGVIEAVGNAVSGFKVGDQVFAFTDASFGCHAEYRTVSQAGMIALKPVNLSFEQAAALSFGGTTALVYLRDKAGIKRGDRVLIVGASGGVGTAAVQLAKHFGAEVTGVCGSGNIELVRSLGADKVVDYTKEDFVHNGEAYDIILDTTGTTSFARCEGSLRHGGRLVLVLASFAQAVGLQGAPKATGKKVIGGVAGPRPDDLRYLAGLAEAADFMPFIDRSYPFERAVEAHAYVDTGRKRGNVVLTIIPGAPQKLAA